MKILYITFIDFDSPSESGSSVRPKCMLEAFQTLGCEVTLLSGITNSRAKRKSGVSRIRSWLKTNRPDICYIEPPTGPLFFMCDRNLIRKLHRMGVPIGFFYRDIYWKFQSDDLEKTNVGWIYKMKALLIRAMQKRDYRMLKRCVDQFYFPSETVNRYMKFENFKVLPPGCRELAIKKSEHTMPTAIYVGGATERYGMRLLLESWEHLNMDQKARLIIVCPKVQWQDWISKHPKYKDLIEGIEVFHLSDGEELEKLYEISDFALIPILKTSYNDMALPIKLYEYISRDLPVVATNCAEMEKVINEYHLGIVKNDNVQDFAEGIYQMITDMEAQKDYRKSLERAKEENTWQKRAKTVIQDLQVKQ